METARLIFGQATASAAVRGGPAQPESAERYAELRKLLSTTPPPGVDLAIVSHGNPFVAVVGPPYLAEGEAAVIRPLANEWIRRYRSHPEGRVDRACRTVGTNRNGTSSRRRPGSNVTLNT